METVLTIAGSDSGAGAGIQADLKAITANGGYALTIVTALTAQNTREVSSAVSVSPEFIEAQFDAIYADFNPGAVKSGMLADRERVEAVARCLRKYEPRNYVLDPVMISKSGYQLLDPDAITALTQQLLPLAEVVTPNIHEAQLLAGMSIQTLDDAREAGVRILRSGPKAVIVKGGHLEAKPGTDTLVTEEGLQTFVGEYIATSNTHGTGCTYSAALATQLAQGKGLVEAIQMAKAYVTEAIRCGLPLGSGAGPTDHFFFLRGKQADWQTTAETAGLHQ